MSWAIFWQTLKSYWLTVVLYCAGLFGYSMFLTSFYPIVQDIGTSYSDIFEKMPEQLREAFGGTSFFEGGLTFEGFLSMEHLNFFWVIIVGAFIVGFAARSFAGEVEQGTIALLLSQPVTRTRIFFSKLLVGIIGIVALVWSVMGGILWQAGRSGVEVAPIEGYLLFIFVAILFFTCILTISLLFSIWANERGRAILMGILFLVISYIADIFARLKPEWEDLAWISLFKYYGKPDETLSTASFDDLNLLVFAGVIIVTITLGVISWNRRDISV